MQVSHLYGWQCELPPIRAKHLDDVGAGGNVEQIAKPPLSTSNTNSTQTVKRQTQQKPCWKTFAAPYINSDPVSLKGKSLAGYMFGTVCPASRADIWNPSSALRVWNTQGMGVDMQVCNMAT